MNKTQRLRFHKFRYRTATPLFSNAAEFRPPSVEAVAKSLDAIIGHLLLELQAHLNPTTTTIVSAESAESERTIALSQLMGREERWEADAHSR
jgi:hypothetical protein